MDEQQFKQFSDKMDTIIRLLALNLVEGKDFKNQVLILSGFGFQPKQIADVLGKTSNNVNVTLHRLRAERREEENEGDQEEVRPGNNGETQHA